MVCCIISGCIFSIFLFNCSFSYFTRCSFLWIYVSIVLILLLVFSKLVFHPSFNFVIFSVGPYYPSLDHHFFFVLVLSEVIELSVSGPFGDHETFGQSYQTFRESYQTSVTIHEVIKHWYFHLLYCFIQSLSLLLLTPSALAAWSTYPFLLPSLPSNPAAAGISAPPLSQVQLQDLLSRLRHFPC